jgi:hypothetical protein
MTSLRILNPFQSSGPDERFVAIFLPAPASSLTGACGAVPRVTGAYLAWLLRQSPSGRAEPPSRPAVHLAPDQAFSPTGPSKPLVDGVSTRIVSAGPVAKRLAKSMGRQPASEYQAEAARRQEDRSEAKLISAASEASLSFALFRAVSLGWLVAHAHVAKKPRMVAIVALLDVMSVGCQVGGPPFRAIEIARVARADRAEPHARRVDHEEV